MESLIKQRHSDGFTRLMSTFSPFLPAWPNRVRLNANQKVELEVERRHLPGRGIITDEQRTQIRQAFLSLQLTAEQTEYERQAVLRPSWL